MFPAAAGAGGAGFPGAGFPAGMELATWRGALAAAKLSRAALLPKEHPHGSQYADNVALVGDAWLKAAVFLELGAVDPQRAPMLSPGELTARAAAAVSNEQLSDCAAAVLLPQCAALEPGDLAPLHEHSRATVVEAAVYYVQRAHGDPPVRELARYLVSATEHKAYNFKGRLLELGGTLECPGLVPGSQLHDPLYQATAKLQGAVLTGPAMPTKRKAEAAAAEMLLRALGVQLPVPASGGSAPLSAASSGHSAGFGAAASGGASSVGSGFGGAMYAAGPGALPPLSPVVDIAKYQTGEDYNFKNMLIERGGAIEDSAQVPGQPVHMPLFQARATLRGASVQGPQMPTKRKAEAAAAALVLQHHGCLTPAQAALATQGSGRTAVEAAASAPVAPAELAKYQTGDGELNYKGMLLERGGVVECSPPLPGQPVHAPLFQATARVRGVTVTGAAFPTKKRAEADASRTALLRAGLLPPNA